MKEVSGRKVELDEVVVPSLKLESSTSEKTIPVMLMTHKCRGSIVVLLISKSVEPNEEQKEMTSGFQ